MFLAQFKNYPQKDKKDHDLWTALQCGQREALSGLFQRYHHHLYNYGIKIVSDKEIVNGSIQQLFLNLWENHEGLSAAYSVKAYLLSSLRRLILKQRKSDKICAERNKDYIADQKDRILSIEHLLIHREVAEERKEQLQKGLAALTPRQKEAVFLKFYHGLSNRELVDVMEIKYQCVRNLLYEAFKRLRTNIETVSLYQE